MSAAFFVQFFELATRDQAKHLESWSGLIAIVVMTLLIIDLWNTNCHARKVLKKSLLDCCVIFIIIHA